MKAEFVRVYQPVFCDDSGNRLAVYHPDCDDEWFDSRSSAMTNGVNYFEEYGLASLVDPDGVFYIDIPDEIKKHLFIIERTYKDRVFSLDIWTSVTQRDWENWKLS